MTSGGPYGPVGTRVLFENDRVRVWEVELQPGETLPMHHHALDYVVVSVTGGPTTVVFDDGRVVNNQHAPGAVVWQTAPHTHELTNDGPHVYRNRFIELKR